MKQTLIFGHRGASKRAPENTIKAFRLAFEEGAEGIEFDIRLSADNEIVVIHDATIDRTSNGIGKVNELNFSELSEYNFGEGEKIPSLREVLKIFGNTYWLNIEIKEIGLEEILVDLLLELRITEKIVISSFLLPALVKIKELDENLSTAYLYDFALDDLESLLEEVQVDGIHPGKKNTTKNIVQAAHEKKLAVRVWTVDDPKLAKELTKYGVDAIITNAPKEIIVALEAKNS